MVSFRKTLVLVPLCLAGCVGKPVAPPQRAPVLRPAPPPPAAPAASWEDGVLTPGSWSYTRDSRGGLALYGIAGSNAVLTIRCDTTTRRIFVSRPGNLGGRMTLRTTFGVKIYDAKPVGGAVPYVAAEIAPTDPQLDALAFSRGRFLVGFGGAPDIVVPSWPEVSRVIEDCRG